MKGGALKGRLSFEELLVDDEEGAELFERWKLGELEKIRERPLFKPQNQKVLKRKRCLGKLPNGWVDQEKLVKGTIKFNPKISSRTVKKVNKTIKGFRDYRKQNKLL
jgi:hypothetical protein